ncbi:MAG: glycosyltransferase [Bdellovibrionales bacterium]
MTADSIRKKVLFVLPALTAGGAERVLITLMNGVDRNKFDPLFLTVINKGELRDIIDPQIPFHTLNAKSVFCCLIKLYKFIKYHDPDTIVSTMAHMNFALLFLKPFLSEKKVIVREAITPSFFFQKYKKSAFAIKLLYQFLYARANVVLSPSQIIFDEFRDLLRMSSNNFYLLPNPVNIEQIKEMTFDQKISKERKRTVHFLSAGRLGRQKGFDRLIEYLPQMEHKFDWKLTIIGEGSERTNLETLVKKHGFQDKIVLPGLVRPPWSHYMEADCFLMPSRFEGLPNVVLESLACGTPVIATKESGGIQYIMDESPKGSVTVVNNMWDFLKEMEKVKPVPSRNQKKSLLNPLFTPPVVFKKFEEILLHEDEEAPR